MRIKRSLCLLFLASWILSPSALLAQARGLRKVQVGVPAISMGNIIIYFAKEAKIFEKYGLDVEPVAVAGSGIASKALISGSVLISPIATPTVMTAVLAGSDMVILAHTMPGVIQTLMVRPDIKRDEDLKGKTVSVNKGSAYDSWARDLEGKIGWKVESFGTQTDAVQAVLVGRADANVAGNTVIAWAVKNNPQLELSFLHSTGLVWAAPLRKDSGELRKMLDVAVECMKLDGTIAKMHEKWFGVAPAAGSAAVTVFPGYGVPDMSGYDPTPHTPSCS